MEAWRTESSRRTQWEDLLLRNSADDKIEMFPSNLVASMFGFKKESFFEADEKERENVKVKF